MKGLELRLGNKYSRTGNKKFSARKQHSNLKVFALILLISFGIGTLIFKFLNSTVYFNNIAPSSTAKKSSQVENSASINNIFIFIQGGIFANKDYADKCAVNMAPFGNVINFNSDKGIKVLIGVYNTATADDILSKIKAANLDGGKVQYQIDNKSVIGAQVCQMINALNLIIQRLNDTQVKAIGTADLKTWVSSIKPADSKDKYYALSKEIKTYIEALPIEVDKTNIPAMLNMIYEKLNKIKGI
ncbi:MAG TPA: hypothetical protein VIK72_17320 [Clostridiaceae bacterium]